MSGLDTARIKFSITAEEKFKYKLTLIQLIQRNRSTTNNAEMKTNTLKHDTS